LTPTWRPRRTKKAQEDPGYADTTSHGRARFVIALTSNDAEMRFRLLRAVKSGL
jgi:hypothetical protein